MMNLFFKISMVIKKKLNNSRDYKSSILGIARVLIMKIFQGHLYDGPIRLVEFCTIEILALEETNRSNLFPTQLS